MSYLVTIHFNQLTVKCLTNVKETGSEFGWNNPEIAISVSAKTRRYSNIKDNGGNTEIGMNIQ